MSKLFLNLQDFLCSFTRHARWKLLISYGDNRTRSMRTNLSQASSSRECSLRVSQLINSVKDEVTPHHQVTHQVTHYRRRELQLRFVSRSEIRTFNAFC